jgi:RNA polymerase sigma factor (sigma-70 family)
MSAAWERTGGEQRCSGDAGLGADSAGEWRTLVRLGYLLTGSREQGEDLAQDAYAALASHKASPGDQPITDQRAFLRRVVSNRAASFHRRRFTARRAPGELQPLELPVEIDETVQGVQRLTNAQRVAVVLRYYLDWSLEDISSSTGRPLSTVKSDLHRALARLRRELS